MERDFIPPEWTSLFDQLFVPSKICGEPTDPLRPIEANRARIGVFGGKGVGKSTFTRWLINSFLEAAESGDLPNVSSVIYIDLDPGQAEFTPPGLISVLRISEPVQGPNHSHLKTPLLSKFLGNLNVSDCARIYVRSCKEILDFLQSNPYYKDLPWIINTMGFCKGLGVRLACEVIGLLCPNVVLQIGLNGISGEETRLFPFHLRREQVLNYLSTTRPHVNGISPSHVEDYQFISVDSVLCSFPVPVRKSIWNARSRDQRDRVMVSYFAPVAQETDDNKLISATPRLISLDSVAVATMQSTLSYEDILRAINGNLVALCNIRPTEISDSPRMMVKAERFPNHCLGYGIVRSMDRVLKILYVITPLPQQLLEDQVNCIVAAGAIGLPLELYLQGLGQEEDGRLPYVERKSHASSKLHESTKRRFVPNRVAHSALKQCLM